MAPASKLEIRQVCGEELRHTLFPLWAYPFLSSREPPSRYDEIYQEMAASREERYTLIGYEADRAVASAQSILMRQNIRGALLPMAGVCGVMTSTESRRRGYSRQIMQSMFRDMAEAGYGLTCLYPFRESFYERMGYVTFPQTFSATCAPDALVPILKMNLPGQVEAISLWEAWETYRQYMSDFRDITHGMAQPTEASERRQFDKGGQVWLATARRDGQMVGLMTYQLTDFWGELQASGFYCKDAGARYLLLAWIARHIDQVKTVKLRLHPAEQPELWISDLDVLRRSWDWVTPMGRVLDAARLDGIPAGDGEIRIGIRDEYCPWNEGAFQFFSDGGRLVLSKANHADLELSIQGLSALIYGTHDPEVFPYRGWGHPTPGQCATLRRMFPRQLPYLYADY